MVAGRPPRRAHPARCASSGTGHVVDGAPVDATIDGGRSAATLNGSHRHSSKVHLLAAEPCALATATELEMAPGAPVFHSVIVHYEDERPIQVEDRYVKPAFAPDYPRQDFTRATPNEYLMGLGPLDEAEHVIQALLPDRRTRSLLKMAAGEPVLHVRRRTWSGGTAVTSARLIHPGSGYSLVGRFVPRQRGRG